MIFNRLYFDWNLTFEFFQDILRKKGAENVTMMKATDTNI